MITNLLYRCPVCQSFDWLDGNSCVFCGATVDITSRTEISINGQQESIAFWYDKIYNLALPKSNEEGIILKSKQIKLSAEQAEELYKGLAGITATHFTKKPMDEGVLCLAEDRLIFFGDREGKRTLHFDSIKSVTIESNTVIVVFKGHGALFFDFLEESGKKWEDCIQKAVSNYYAPKEIVEFCPKLLFESDLRVSPRPTRRLRPIKVPVKRWYKRDPRVFYAAVRRIARPIIKALFSVRVEGIENIPKKGPAVILSNHSSFFDSIILGVLPKRYIWYMTKSSQYKSDFLRWFLKFAKSFPVRRYTTDVLAVRNAIRVVQQGHILGIFPEGERSWDGSLLPFKQGTIRLILALGHPVIPVGISGSYGIMPRWTSKIKRAPVTIRIGAPLYLGHIPIPKHTKDIIRKVSDEVRSRIISLIGAPNIQGVLYGGECPSSKQKCF